MDKFPGHAGRYGQIYRDPQDKNLHIVEIRIPQEVQTTGCLSFERFKRVIGTLLHEMTHAVFAIYKCRCRSCSCLVTVLGLDGIEGHGPSFRDLGGDIQDMMNHLFSNHRPWDLNAAQGSDSHIREINARIDHGFSEWD